jgi:hypothetical protein
MLNDLHFMHADTLADLDEAQTYLVIFVRSEGAFYRYDDNTDMWVIVS